MINLFLHFSVLFHQLIMMALKFQFWIFLKRPIRTTFMSNILFGKNLFMISKNSLFHFPAHLDFLHHGISPFLLQKLSQHQEAELYLFDDAAAQATHVGMQDISCHNCHSSKTVQPDSTAFLEIIATFWALILILFDATSSTFLDTNEIYHICLDSHCNSYLDAIHSCQADWFVHVFWALTCTSQTNFQTALWLDQLTQGLQLPCPFCNILPTIWEIYFFHPSHHTGWTKATFYYATTKFKSNHMTLSKPKSGQWISIQKTMHSKLKQSTHHDPSTNLPAQTTSSSKVPWHNHISGFTGSWSQCSDLNLTTGHSRTHMLPSYIFRCLPK